MKVGEYHQDRNGLYFVSKNLNNEAEILRLDGKIETKDIEIAERIQNNISIKKENPVYFIFSNINEAFEYLEAENMSYDKSNVFEVLAKATDKYISNNPDYNLKRYLFYLNGSPFCFKIPIIKIKRIEWVILNLLAEENKWDFPITLSCNENSIWYTRTYGYHHKEDREIIDLEKYKFLKLIHHEILKVNYIGKRFQFDEKYCRLNDNKNEIICFIDVEKAASDEKPEDLVRAVRNWFKN